MKALVKFAKGPGNVEIREVPDPCPADNQVRLAVSYCGICGTDLHVYRDTFRNFPPVILGHEFCGRVVERGRGIDSINEGDRFTVLGASTVTCGRCVYCRQGEFMFCPDRRGMGHGVNGAFAPYAVARPDQLFKLPDNLPDEEASLCEPFAAAVHAVCDLTPPRLGDVAVISGSGPIGLLCLKLLVAQGLKTIVLGTAQDKLRLEKAQQMGAAVVCDVTARDPLELVRSETDGFGADLVFECAGAAASARTCFDVARPLGSFTQVGHFGGNIELNFDRVAFKQLRVNGSVGYTAATWTRMLKILASGEVRLGDMISHRLPLEKWAAGFTACEDKSALKVLLGPAQTSVRLKSKIILVTGASKGIGRALALGVAREGADVVVNYHSDEAGARAVAREIEALGRRAEIVQANISEVGQIHGLFARIRRDFGRLDVLINNAGITGWTALFEVTEEKWNEVLNTNLRGTFFCALEAAKMMRTQGGGSIINVSTNCAELGVKNLVAYAASKGGIHALTKQLAVELAPFKIRVNTFAPGPIRIERNLRDDPNFESAWSGVVPLGRVGEPEEMIGPAVFLASEESSYMTGQTFFVDGGWTVQGKIPEANMDAALKQNRGG